MTQQAKPQISTRISHQQMQRLAKLQEKLCLDRTAVINLALKRLADSEGIK